MPKYEALSPVFTYSNDSAHLKEGRRIVLMMCIKCHYDAQTNTLAGGDVANPGSIGDNFASNITADSATGIGRWSTGQLAFFLRTGIKPDGYYVYDMPKYPGLSNDDLGSIIAFLRSDDSLVRAVNKPVAPEPINPVVKIFARTLLRPYAYATAAILPPDTNNPIEFGRYLAPRKFSCYECHSNDLVGNYHNDFPERSDNFFAGGAKHTNSEHGEIYSSNITFDEETGIGKWSETEFLRTVKNGIKPDGKTVRDPMQPFYLLTDKEVLSIYAYLATLPRIHNKVR
ncbi:MAG: hypothetical protein U0V74_12155 [Chitinophagales bacterium]